MKHLKEYKIFENNQQVIDEFFSVMQGTPEGTDFMKWFVADPKRTGRVYITSVRGSGANIPNAYFDKISDNRWKYEYSSAGKRYGEQYGDLKWLFRRMVFDAVIKNLPPGIKKSEMEHFLVTNKIAPGTLPDNTKIIIEDFIGKERGELIKDFSFIKEIPWIKSLVNTRLYDIKDYRESTIIQYNSWNEDEALGFTSEFKNIIGSIGIGIHSMNSLNSITFVPGPEGRTRKKDNYRGSGRFNYKFILGYKTEEEVINVIQKEINKIIQELNVSFYIKSYNPPSKNDVPFIADNLKSLIVTGKFLPDYKQMLNDFMSDLIIKAVEKDLSKIDILKGETELLDILRNKRPDLFGESKEKTQDIIKGSSTLKRFGTFDED